MGSQRQVLEDRVAVQSGSAAQAYEIITRPATDPQMSETLVRNIDNTVSFDQDMPPMSDPEGLGLDPNTRPSHTLMPPLSNEEDESGQSAHSINLMDYLATLETLNTDESSTRFAQALGFGGNFDPDSLLL
ncbi:hypothetical protein KVT40_001167 [Elsinoe batatas]|uniref:Uncharacterized protein n=1 Tax=Elsinoe batatas TaxID=2601811 RepID=A0A8K0PKZ3_9PEZI|nr:hypothetical protein KVT40_001167 [Elsinoe batatas]